jgi:ketosteroid isomerase-like protein
MRPSHTFTTKTLTTTLLALATLMGCVDPRAEWEAEPATPEVFGVPQERVDLIQRRLAANNAQDGAAWEALHTPDCRRYAPELEEPLESASEMRAAIQRLWNGFPDYRLVAVRMMGNGDAAAVEMIASGRLTRPYVLGDGLVIPPNNRRFIQRSSFFFRFEGDRISEVREYYDQQEVNSEVLGLP